MPTREELDAKLIEVSEKAKARLRELGWTDEQIEAEMRTPKRGKRRA